jgi:hypothetical protein
MVIVCRETIMVVEALMHPKWKVMMDVLTCFVHGPAKHVYYADAILRGGSIWNKPSDTTVDLSRRKEHHRMAFP